MQPDTPDDELHGLEAREAALGQVTRAAYNSVYGHIYRGAGFSQAESDLMWMRVINQMVASTILELEHRLDLSYDALIQTETDTTIIEAKAQLEAKPPGREERHSKRSAG